MTKEESQGNRSQGKDEFTLMLEAECELMEITSKAKLIEKITTVWRDSNLEPFEVFEAIHCIAVVTHQEAEAARERLTRDARRRGVLRAAEVVS